MNSVEKIFVSITATAVEMFISRVGRELYSLGVLLDSMKICGEITMLSMHNCVKELETHSDIDVDEFSKKMTKLLNEKVNRAADEYVAKLKISTSQMN